MQITRPNIQTYQKREKIILKTERKERKIATLKSSIFFFFFKKQKGLN